MASPEVGGRVRVCHSDGYWYYGTLESKDEKKNKYTVAFDDGDRIVSALPHRDIQVLAAGLMNNIVSLSMLLSVILNEATALEQRRNEKTKV